jgi:hypothetical protein
MRKIKYYSPQRHKDTVKILKASFAAKNAKSANKNLYYVFNFAHFAFFAAEKYFFLCASVPLW